MLELQEVSCIYIYMIYICMSFARKIYVIKICGSFSGEDLGFFVCYLSISSSLKAVNK